ncbi:uncharacterized protein LOC143292453 isoform X2 [Babylonia areolata]|uniref:uncharacterized protein LOC143292453 isoform X2 n=1 Tax=Babylonia areolata TaxID=304850 RepID=UPI003FCF134C
MDCFRQKRRRRKEEREQQKFRQLTPHTSPTHSQPSTLSHGPQSQVDPARLPKVGSNGLWMGAPGIYASTPSPAYGLGGGRPGGKSHHLMQPAVMQRASSDPRLLQSRASVYSTGGSQQRIYHSQGIPLPSPLSPVYEFRDPDGYVYDVYQIGGGSTNRLLQDSSSKSGKGGKRVQRSQSDLVTEPSRRAYRTKPSSAELRASRASSNKDRSSPGSTITEKAPPSLGKDSLNKETARVHQQRGVDNPIFIESLEKISPEEKVAVVSSATDSMKLLAKNKTDDQKTVRQSSSTPENTPPENQSHLGGHVSSTPPDTGAVPDPTSSSSLHYSYQGDIYAVPDKPAVRNRSTTSDDATPVVAAAEEQSAADRVRAGPLADSTEKTTGSLTVDDTPGYEALVVHDPIYQEVGDPGDPEPSLTHTSDYQELGEVLQKPEDETVVAGARTSGVKDSVTEVVPTAGSAVDVYEEVVVSGEVAGSEVAAASATISSGRDVGASGQMEGQPGARQLLEQLSVETDVTSDELTRAGKHISVTAEAFEFLDTYLSDEDGADINSPPKSPVMTDRSELM